MGSFDLYPTKTKPSFYENSKQSHFDAQILHRPTSKFHNKLASLPNISNQQLKMCFLVHKTYDCQHVSTITTPCRQYLPSWTRGSKDCPNSLVTQHLRSINLCAECRSRVPGYKFVSEMLQEYKEHWNMVDWQKGASLRSTKSCPPGVDEDEVIRRLRRQVADFRKRA
jgi:hypothetical protein